MFRKLPNIHQWSLEYNKLVNIHKLVNEWSLYSIRRLSSYVNKNKFGTGLVVARIWSDKKLWEIAYTFLQSLWLESYCGLVPKW